MSCLAALSNPTNRIRVHLGPFCLSKEISRLSQSRGLFDHGFCRARIVSWRERVTMNSCCISIVTFHNKRSALHLIDTIRQLQARQSTLSAQLQQQARLSRIHSKTCLAYYVCGQNCQMLLQHAIGTNIYRACALTTPYTPYTANKHQMAWRMSR